jgi:CBS domain-containing protein
MLVRDVLSNKGQLVHSCGPGDTLADAADLMVGHNIGSLIVMQDDEMVGIVTERDILRACAATRGPLEFLSVR